MSTPFLTLRPAACGTLLSVVLPSGAVLVQVPRDLAPSTLASLREASQWCGRGLQSECAPKLAERRRAQPAGASPEGAASARRLQASESAGTHVGLKAERSEAEAQSWAREASDPRHGGEPFNEAA